jgi:YVTN family beta-propeller protein
MAAPSHEEGVVTRTQGGLVLGFVLLSLVVPVVARAQSPAYQVRARIAVGGEGGWDLLAFDAAHHHLFVSRGTRVQVVDVERDTLAAEIPDTPGVHGIALAPEFGHGFTTNARDSSVTVFDLGTLAAVATVKLPARNPDAITYDPVSKRVFVMNAGSSSATAIDASTNTIAGTVALGGRPELAVADGHGKLFVNLEDSSAVVAVDTRTLAVLSTWPLAPGEEPTGLAMDLVHRRLFAGCHNQRLIVLDADSGKRIADLPIGRGVDGVAFDPGLGRVLSSNGEGTLSVIQQDSADKYHALGDVPTQRGARTLTLDEGTHVVFTVTAEFGETPAATPDHPHPRPSLVPGTFTVLVLEAKGAGAARH